MPRLGCFSVPYHFFLLPVANFQQVEGDEEKGATSAPLTIFLGSLSDDSSVHLTVTTAASSTLFLCRAHQCR